MKFGSSSSGCKPRPAKGEPAQPVASLATDAATRSAMRRRASMWAVGKAATKTISTRVPRVSDSPKATAFSPQQGEEGPHPAGCTTTARSKRTVQAPGRPTFLLGKPPEQRRAGDPSPTRRAPADARAAGRCHASGCAQKKHPRRGRPLARGDRSRGRRERGESEGRIRAVTSGNGVAPGPGRAKVARAEVSFRRET